MFSKALGLILSTVGLEGRMGVGGGKRGWGEDLKEKIIQGELQVEMNAKINICQFPTFQIN